MNKKNLFLLGWTYIYENPSTLLTKKNLERGDELPIKNWNEKLLNIPFLTNENLYFHIEGLLSGDITEKRFFNLTYRAIEKHVSIEKELYCNIISTNSIENKLRYLLDGLKLTPTELNIPRLLVRTGINAIQSSVNGSSERKIILGLTAIGLAGYIWKQPKICDFCFRIASLKSKYCFEHLIDHNATKKNSYLSNQDGKHRIGRDASELLEKNHSIDWEKQRNNIHFGVTSLFFISDVIEPEVNRVIVENIDKENDFLSNQLAAKAKENFRELLHKYPIVCAKLNHGKGDDYLTKFLFDFLREKLDCQDYQRSLYLWELKIRAAEIWFAAENEIISTRKKGRPKISNTQSGVIKEYINLGLSKSEIAKKLGISPSNLSNRISRDPSVKEAFKKV